MQFHQTTPNGRPRSDVDGIAHARSREADEMQFVLFQTSWSERRSKKTIRRGNEEADEAIGDPPGVVTAPGVASTHALDLYQNRHGPRNFRIYTTPNCIWRLRSPPNHGLRTGNNGIAAGPDSTPSCCVRSIKRVKYSIAFLRFDL